MGMGSKTKSQTGTFRIDSEQDGERTFLLRENDDIYLRSGAQIIASCKLGLNVEAWMQEFQLAMEHIAAWASKNPSVRSCYFGPPGSHLSLFFFPKSESFDFDLAFQLADLQAEVTRNFNVGAVELHQIPWREWERFLSVESSRWVYGEKFKPCESVET